MATIIDSLIVTLGLDSKDVDAKAPGVKRKLADLEKEGEKVKKGTQDTGKAFKETGAELSSLAGKMASFLALIGGTVALRHFALQAIETNTHLSNLSKNLSIPVWQLSAWSIASTMVGGSAQEMQGFIAHLTTESANLANGLGSSLIPVLGKMGIAMIDGGGKARSALDELQDMAKWAQGKDRKQVFAWFQQAGMPAGVANLLLENPQKFAAMLDQAKRYSATEQNASSAAQMTMQIALLHAQFNKLGYELLETVTPFLEKFFAVLKGGLDWCITHQTAVASFLAALAAGIGAVSAAMALLFLSTIEISGPILLAVAAIAALAAAFTAATLDYSKWSQGGASLFDWTGFETNIRKAGDAFKWLGDKIEEATDRFENWLRKQGFNVPEGAAKKGLKWWWNNLTLPGLLGIKTNDIGGVDEKGNLSPVQIQKYYQEKGYSKGWAAAMAASAMGESSGNPNSVGDNGTSFGLFQWHSQDRKDKFRSIYGHDISSANAMEQLDFADREVRGLGINPSSRIGARYAAAILTQRFERPKDMAGDSAKRGAYAEQLINGISGASSVPSSVSTQTSPSSTSNDNSRVTHIGKIEIHTQATDAKSIWHDMQRGMDWLTATPANSGLV